MNTTLFNYCKKSNRKISDVTRELGIPPELLYRLKIEYAANPEQVFPGKDRMKLEEEYGRRLKREFAHARAYRDILTKPWLTFPRTNDEV